MLYCPNCQTLYAEGRCPICGKARGRLPQEDDLCLLTEKKQIEADILEDVLRQNGVQCLKQSVSGVAIALYTGLYAETFRLLVPFPQWEAAQEIMNQFFSADCEILREAEDESEEDDEHGPDDD